VKYQGQDDNNGVTFSSLALMRWLEVTLPLTALTLFVAWSTYQMYDASRDGMTTSERIKSIFGSKRYALAPSGMHASPQVGHGKINDAVWRAARHLSNLVKPRGVHNQWSLERSSALPLHTVTQSGSGT
jgi:hypothetical protein